jgi:hypothetical protein
MRGLGARRVLDGEKLINVEAFGIYVSLSSDTRVISSRRSSPCPRLIQPFSVFLFALS